MHIAADENIPLVEEAFAQFGPVQTFAGRDLQASDLGNAELLLVRSVTQVGPTLLANSQVRFVASATIGMDHIDQQYLQRQDIGFAGAPGCNAASVAEYVLSTLVVVARRQRFDWRNCCVGLVGCGNVGRAVKKRMEVLGLKCLINDPPLQEADAEGHFVSLEEALQADVVSLHVPLSVTGPHATQKMVNHQFLRQMRPGALFLNTSRGATMDPSALQDALREGWAPTLALDVWDHEPAIDVNLMQQCLLATPHIAGYSLDGKVGGTAMIYQAACDFFKQPAKWQPETAMPSPSTPYWQANPEVSTRENIENAILRVYDIRQDDQALRKVSQQPKETRPGYFDALRKHYPIRREFKTMEARIPEDCVELGQVLSGLGFRVLVQ